MNYRAFKIIFSKTARQQPVGYYAGVDYTTSTPPTNIYWKKWDPTVVVDNDKPGKGAVNAAKASYMPESARLLRYDKAVPGWEALQNRYSMTRMDKPEGTLRDNLNRTYFTGERRIPAPSMQSTGNYINQKNYLESLRNKGSNKAVNKALDAMEMTKAQYKFYREWLKATGGKSRTP